MIFNGNCQGPFHNLCLKLSPILFSDQKLFWGDVSATWITVLRKEDNQAPPQDLI